MINTIEQMAIRKVAVYALPSRFIPDGLPLDIAKEKAADASPNFKFAIQDVTESDVTEYARGLSS